MKDFGSFWGAPKISVSKKYQINSIDIVPDIGMSGKIIKAWAVGESGMGGDIIRTDVYYGDEQAAKLSAPPGDSHSCTTSFWCPVLLFISEPNGSAYMIFGRLHPTEFGGNAIDIQIDQAIKKLSADECAALGLTKESKEKRCPHGILLPHECRECEAAITNEEVKEFAAKMQREAEERDKKG